MDTRYLPETEFKTLVKRTLNKLRRGIEGLSDNFNREIENTKKNQSGMKNTITEMNNKLEGIKIKLDKAED